jgi:hypothetical protein
MWNCLPRGLHGHSLYSFFGLLSGPPAAPIAAGRLGEASRRSPSVANTEIPVPDFAFELLKAIREKSIPYWSSVKVGKPSSSFLKKARSSSAPHLGCIFRATHSRKSLMAGDPWISGILWSLAFSYAERHSEYQRS